MPPPTAGEEMPLPPSSVTEEPTALERAIAARDADENRLALAERLAQGLAPAAEVTAAGTAANRKIRVELELLLRMVKELPPSRERSLCATKIEEASFWIDADINRLGLKP